MVRASIYGLLNPELTASWEKGLTQMAEGTITEDYYMQKLEKYITDKTQGGACRRLPQGPTPLL